MKRKIGKHVYRLGLLSAVCGIVAGWAPKPAGYFSGYNGHQPAGQHEDGPGAV